MTPFGKGTRRRRVRTKEARTAPSLRRRRGARAGDRSARFRRRGRGAERRPPPGGPQNSFGFRVGIWSCQSLLDRSCLGMHLMPPNQEGRSAELETIALSGKHLDYLGQLAHELNPDMPASFGLPHLIRALLDRVEQSGIDLTDACSEEEIARLAAGRLRRETTSSRRRTPRPSERLFASCSSAARRSYRSSLPETDRFRSGKPPRSDRG